MRKLSESVWGDLRKKSLGQEEREEDSYKGMNIGEFEKYLKDHYEWTDKYKNNTFPMIGTNLPKTFVNICVIGVVESPGKKTFIYLGYRFNNLDRGDYTVTITKTISPNHNELHIYDFFFFFYTLKETKEWSYEIIPEDREVNNEFFMEVLDFIINNTKYPEESAIQKKR